MTVRIQPSHVHLSIYLSLSIFYLTHSIIYYIPSFLLSQTYRDPHPFAPQSRCNPIHMADAKEHHIAMEEKDSTLESQPQKTTDTQPFPDGGTRAWLVACGCAGILFCTFGYANAFG